MSPDHLTVSVPLAIRDCECLIFRSSKQRPGTDTWIVKVSVNMQDTRTGILDWFGSDTTIEFAPKRTLAHKKKVLLDTARKALHSQLCHEVDEAICIDGKRPFDPHKGRKKRTP